MIKFLFPAILLFISGTVQPQKLFTYGKYAVDAKEFLWAFNKNNPSLSAAERKKTMNEYLQRYINSKLKVREAYARGYDTLPSLMGEVENLRLQIVDKYMSDPQALDKLTKEAFIRSQKDIHAAHIYISLKNTAGTEDLADAEKRKDEVMKRLAAVEDFAKVAAELSDDPSAKINGGDLGYITVFTLPYVFENIVYNTPAGKHSAPYRSKSGYHIFKKINERTAIGKLKAQQILLAFPPGSDENEKMKIKNRADSLYQSIMAGDDFSKLAVDFSNDYMSASANGNMPAFGIGQYEPEFEKIAFGLKKDGEVSRPFTTAHGIHILKRMGSVQIVSDSNNRENMDQLRSAVNTPERTAASQRVMVERVKKLVGFKTYPYKAEVLKAYTDSILDNKRIGIGVQQDKNALLFKAGDSSFRVPDWIGYAQVFRYNTTGGIKSTDELMEEFIQSNVMLYYKEHLEKYNEEFRYQMNEIKDGNLFFEIMPREVWNAAQTDTAGLKNYFEKNKTKYTWKPSADAVIFYCNADTTAMELYGKIKASPPDWKNFIQMYEERVSADSSRVEQDAIPVKTKTDFTPGMITPPVVNETDGSASFAYIIRVYNNTAPRSFEEAKGLVISDYQNVLDEKWVTQLKKKYPVAINQKVLLSILK